MILIHTKYCTVEQVKKDMIGRACGLNDREEEFHHHHLPP